MLMMPHRQSLGESRFMKWGAGDESIIRDEKMAFVVTR